MINLSFNVTTLFISISVIIAVTFGLLLFFSNKTNKTANRFLAIMLFIVAFWNISLLILELAVYQFVVGIIWVPFTYTLALGPSLYFYVYHVTKIQVEHPKKLWLHYVPVSIQIVLFLIQVFIAIPLGKGYNQTELFQLTNPAINLFAISSLLIYSLYARKRVLRYHSWVKNNYSNDHKYQLRWLTRLLTGFLLLMVVWLVYILIYFFFYSYALIFLHYYPFYLSLAVISIWLSVEAYALPDIIFPDIKIVAKQNLSSSQLQPCKDLITQAKWLEQQIASNHLYLDPELSLKSLAFTLDIHPNVTSKLINDGLGKSFSDCINEFRVAAVKAKLVSPEEPALSLLAIAFDCGFNSKTSFNRIFKKHVGMTPIQYQKSKKVKN